MEQDQTKNTVYGKDGITVYQGDAFAILPEIDEHSVHMILTDPPYFLEKLDTSWNDQKIKNDKTKGQRIKNLPAGMKFSPQQSIRFGEFFVRFAKEAMRILVPGGFFLSFAQGRLYQRMAVASEDAGFWIRNMLAWCYTSKTQPKAFTLVHFVKRNASLSEQEKDRLVKLLENRRTPQLTSVFEPIMLAQKPLEGSFIHNFDKWGVGLIDGSKQIQNKFPTSMLSVEKPGKEERTSHPTQKPRVLLEELMEIFSQEGQTILDPFLGSGSTALAALRTHRLCIGIEKDPDYIAIIRERLLSDPAI